MKKIIKILFTGLIIVSVASTTACSDENKNDDNSSQTESEVTISNNTVSDEQLSPQNIADDILEQVEFSSAVSKSINEINDYIDIDVNFISQMSYYICGSGAYPDELLIIELTDKSNVEDIEKIIQKRLDSQTEAYRDYAPAEMYKLEGAKITNKDNWVFFYAMSDNEKVTDIINSYF